MFLSLYPLTFSKHSGDKDYITFCRPSSFNSVGQNLQSEIRSVGLDSNTEYL